MEMRLVRGALSEATLALISAKAVT